MVRLLSKFLPQNNLVGVAVVTVYLDRFAALEGTGVDQSFAEHFDQLWSLAFLAGKNYVNSLGLNNSLLLISNFYVTKLSRPGLFRQDG